MTNLGRCVDLLHSHGIVHLALHPNNVFVGPAPAYEVRVHDFGSGAVRRALRSRDEPGKKAAWFAPEQLENDAVCDARADVFAAALLAFFAASGRPYWRSCQDGEVDLAELRREMLGPRVPVSERARELSLTMKPGYDAVFARALAVSPKDRFGTVGELAGALAIVERGSIVPPVGASFPPLGVNASVDVPPPPAQMEAVLSAFEGGRSKARGVGAMVADTLAQAAPVSVAAESLEQDDVTLVDEMPDVLEGDRAGKSARVRLYAVGVAALLLGMGGAYALFSTGKTKTAHATESSVPAPKPVVSASPVEPPPAPPVPPVVAAPPPTMAAEEPPPEAQPAPPASAAAPARPVWKRPPPAPRPPPAKKPCGKFLKRCT
jgi:hypothetical protein